MTLDEAINLLDEPMDELGRLQQTLSQLDPDDDDRVEVFREWVSYDMERALYFVTIASESLRELRWPTSRLTPPSSQEDGALLSPGDTIITVQIFMGVVVVVREWIEDSIPDRRGHSARACLTMAESYLKQVTVNLERWEVEKEKDN